MSRNPECGRSAKDWERVFARAGIRADKLGDCKSAHARATKIGQFLGRSVDREVPVCVEGRTGTAILRRKQGRARAQCYYFELRFPTEKTPAEGSVDQPFVSVQLGKAAEANINEMSEPSLPSEVPLGESIDSQTAIGETYDPGEVDLVNHVNDQAVLEDAKR